MDQSGALQSMFCRSTLKSRLNISQAVVSTLQLFAKLDAWITEIPPLPTPQRFGNLAFRTWGKRLEDVGLQLTLDHCGTS